LINIAAALHFFGLYFIDTQGYFLYTFNVKKKALINFSIFPKDDPKQALRIRRFLMASAAYVISAILCYFAYFAGFLKWEALVGVWICASIINIVLYIFFRTGLNMKMADPSLTIIQMCAAIILVMYIMSLANEARGVILLIYVIILLFGIFRLNTRGFLYVSIFTLLTYGGVIAQLHVFRPQGVNFHMEYLQWVVLALVLVIFSIIGGYISGLRTKISKDRSTIQRMTDNIHDVIFVLDMNLNYTYVSPSVKVLRGYEPEEVLKQTPFDAIMPSSLDLAMRTLSEFMELGKLEHKEDIFRTLQLEIRRKDGTTVWTETKFSFIRDKNQRTLHILGVMRDITERKQMEESLRQSEEKHRNIIETIQEGYFEVDLTGNFTFFNDSMCRILGYPPEEMMGMNNQQYTDKDHAKRLYKLFAEVYRTGEPAKGSDWQIIRKDGTNKIGEVLVSLQKDSSGNPIGFSGTVRDATERKTMEEALRQNEERYRTILDEMADAYFEVDLAGNYTFVNDACCRHLGYPREELIGASFRDQMAKEEIDKVFKAFNKIFRTGKPEKVTSYKVLRKDGTTGFTEMTGFPMKNQQGQVIGFRGVGHDITEHKQMEESLRRGEEKYRTILESIQEAYFEVDLTGNFTFCNDSMCRLTGCSKEELVGMNHNQFTSKETAKEVFQAFNKVYTTGEPSKAFDWQVIRKDGVELFIEASVTLQKDS